MKRVMAGFVLLAGLKSVPAHSADYSATIAEMTGRIEQHLIENQVTGLSIALVDDQETVWARGFGFANREEGILADQDTIYEIGSISKTFTAAAIMRLVEAGKIDLDLPLSGYLPEFSIHQRFESSGPITPRTVLTHHSGIPGDFFNGGATFGRPFDYLAWLLGCLPGEYTAFPVNSHLAYSNSAFALLQGVVARSADNGFHGYTNELFDLIGMAHTSFSVDSRIDTAKLSRSYYLGQELPYPIYCNFGSAGSVLSSVAEMANYLKMIAAGGLTGQGRVLESSSLEEMFRRQNADVYLDFDRAIGLSWFLNNPDTDYAGRRIMHEGATYAFHAQLEMLLDHRLGVVVLSNSMTADVVGLAAKTLELALRDKTGLMPVPTPTPVLSPPDHSWTDERLRALAGTYVTRNGPAFSFDLLSASEGGLLWRSGADTYPSPLFLQPCLDGWFRAQDDPSLQMRFENVSGRAVMIRRVGATNLWGEKFTGGEIPPAWQARIGSYRIANLHPDDASLYFPPLGWVPRVITLSIVDGMLLLDGTLRGEVPIQPVSDTLAFVGGVGRNSGESVRVEERSGEERIVFWGLEYRPARYRSLDSGDYGGDGTAEIAVFRPSSGLWAAQGITRAYFGRAGDIPVSADYSGDGTSEIAVFRPSTGLWAVKGKDGVYFGRSGDLPVPGDYDGSGTSAPGIFRPSSGLWAVRGLTRAYWGGDADIPAPGYYAGDGRNAIGIYRPSSSLWAIQGVTRAYFGSWEDDPVPGDYDGNGNWSPGIFRPSNGLWAVRGVTRASFGDSTDSPVPADYQGDGQDDIGLFRSTSGWWAIRGATQTYFGSIGDIPVTR